MAIYRDTMTTVHLVVTLITLILRYMLLVGFVVNVLID